MVTRFRSFLKRSLGPMILKSGLAGPYRGNVDGTHNGAIIGWVVHAQSRKGYQRVALFSPSGLLTTVIADGTRKDVAQAGLGEEFCGFSFPLTEKLLTQIHADGGLVTIKVLGATEFRLGEVRLQADDPLGVTLAPREALGLRAALHGDLADLTQHLAQQAPLAAGDLPAWQAPALGAHAKMFTTEGLIPDLPATGQTAYMDHCLYRYRLDDTFDVGPGLEASDHFLNWYVTTYRAGQKLRVPLSAQQIDYLNAPMTMGGTPNTLTRIMWWRLTQRHDLLGDLNLQDRGAFLKVLFWWANTDAPLLNMQDCLVPDPFADILRSVPLTRSADLYPLSHFMEHLYQASPQLRFLNVTSGPARKAFNLALLVMAVNRPDMLRYIPTRSISQLLGPRKDAPSDFERLLHLLTEDNSLQCSAETYAAIIRKQGYDLQSHRFTSLSREGHRFEGLALAHPNPDGAKVDVQIIGPLAKSSGLGQAVRLCDQVLRASGHSVRGVNFGMDNPAAEGFNTLTPIEPYGPAKINLIHLNAELIPTVFAYQPDVFSHSYNIGYFYWELDRPALCHYLGIEMLDEIWVATDYGMSIYAKDAKGKPVINVGMCYEDLGQIDRAQARAYLNRRMMMDDGHYVCLVAFDSFSFVQRKNPLGVLKAFQKAFEGVGNARLIVKTQNRNGTVDPMQMAIWDRVDAMRAQDKRIVILNETMAYSDLVRLKAGADCYISLHKSEGWGFGMIEAMNLKVPVVCTAYSGNMDFCRPDTCWLVDYDEVTLARGEYIFVRPNSKWAEPNVEDAAKQLRAVYDNPTEARARAEAAFTLVQNDFSLDTIAGRFGARIGAILEGLK